MPRLEEAAIDMPRLAVPLSRSQLFRIERRRTMRERDDCYKVDLLIANRLSSFVGTLCELFLQAMLYGKTSTYKYALRESTLRHYEGQ